MTGGPLTAHSQLTALPDWVTGVAGATGCDWGDWGPEGGTRTKNFPEGGRPEGGRNSRWLHFQFFWTKSTFFWIFSRSIWMQPSGQIMVCRNSTYWPSGNKVTVTYYGVRTKNAWIPRSHSQVCQHEVRQENIWRPEIWNTVKLTGGKKKHVRSQFSDDMFRFVGSIVSQFSLECPQNRIRRCVWWPWSHVKFTDWRVLASFWPCQTCPKKNDPNQTHNCLWFSALFHKSGTV